MGNKKVHNFASLLRARGRLAQLVQSVCLTSRGSGVRIPQRPQHQPRLNAIRVSALERAAQRAKADKAAGSNSLTRDIEKPGIEATRTHKSITRALSSAGSERLPYKQRVGGSNPSAPTTRNPPAGISSPRYLLFFHSPLPRPVGKVSRRFRRYADFGSADFSGGGMMSEYSVIFAK